MLSVMAIGWAAAVRPERFVVIAALGSALLTPPWIAAPLVAGIVWRHRRTHDPFDEVVLLQATAAELRAGRSLRHALIEASCLVPGLPLARTRRLAHAGRPMSEVAESLVTALPHSGSIVGVAVRISANSGGRVAAVFSTLAAIQADRVELGREVRSATAGVRASVVVVAGLPVAALAHAQISGRLAEVVALGGPGVALLAAGVSLLLLGLASVLVLTRSVR